MIDPTATTALHSLDFGSVYTPDGREHPVTAFTLPFFANLPSLGGNQPSNSQPTSSNPVDPPSTYPATGPNAPTNAGFHIPGLSWPEHFGTRVVVGLVGLIVLTIVVVRLLK
jgi:hypothetical protein